MRKLLLLVALCATLPSFAQYNWYTMRDCGPVIDSHDLMRNTYEEEDLFNLEGRHAYQPGVWVKESRKSRKQRRKARKARRYATPITPTNFKVVPNDATLKIIASIDMDNKEAFHLKLVDSDGRVVQSYIHLPSKVEKEFPLLKLKPGKYHLNLYAGIGRRLLTSYDVNRY